MMMTDEAISFLAALPHRPDAERRISFLPLAGVYWDDEIPDFRLILRLSDSARNEVFRLFAIRVRIWQGERLSEDDETFWSDVRTKVPGYGVFHRTAVSAEDWSAQEAAEKETMEFFDGLAGDAERFDISSDGKGLTRWSATIDLQDLTEDTRALPWWKRLWRRSSPQRH